MVAVVIALAIAGQLEIWISAGELSWSAPIAAAGALLLTLPLLLSRRFPLAAPVLVFAQVAALSLARPEAVTDGATATLFVVLLAFWVLGAGNERHRAIAGVAVGFAAIAVLARTAPSQELANDPLLPAGGVRAGTADFDLVFFVVCGALLPLLARAMTSRARRTRLLEQRAADLGREREQRTRAAVAAERRRIARDLHDVIAHSVSLMTVQAGAARLLLDEQPERARESLIAIDETGRETLGELRRLLGLLRTDEADAALAPRPGLAVLGDLLAQTRTAGLPVDLTVEGRPHALTPGVEAAAYRIVQEALASVRSHAGPARARVVVRYGRDTLDLEVTDDGPGRPDDDAERGLLGMSERVSIYGGELAAGPGAEGGYAVRARLPVATTEPGWSASALLARGAQPDGTSALGPDSEQVPVALWPGLKQYGFDSLVVAVAVVSELEIWVTTVPGPKLVLVPGALLWTLPLLWRRRFPLAAPALVFAVLALTSAADEAVGGGLTGAAALYLAFWAVGAHNSRNAALTGVAIGFASMAVIADRDVRVGSDELTAVILEGGLLSLVAYVLQRRTRRTSALEERTVRLAREREERGRAAIAAERRRIARDLHDVIAHSVGVMTIQAGAARLLLDADPERARDPLRAVEETGRDALGELRRLLDVLPLERQEAALAPQPGLATLPELVARVRTAGLPVELAVEGETPTLAPGVELAAYRIVQEALTNARKHAGPARARVSVRCRDESLELEIANDGRPAPQPGSRGHGLVGMRERAALYGGDLEAGPQQGGGFLVRARLPVNEPSRARLALEPAPP